MVEGKDGMIIKIVTVMLVGFLLFGNLPKRAEELKKAIHIAKSKTERSQKEEKEEKKEKKEQRL